MKNKLLFFTILVITSFFIVKETYAYDKYTYANRPLCGNYEVALFKADGTIETKSCHSGIDPATEAMVAGGSPDLVVLGYMDGATKIMNANAALVDLSHLTNTFNLYDSNQLNTAHTYMVGTASYGGADAAFVDLSYSNYKGTLVAKIKTAGYTGWVQLASVEIVPLVWVQSSSSYTITSTSIRHNFIDKIQNVYTGSRGITFGPKPPMLNEGTYYSYDGHYFYNDRIKMINDYRSGTYNNAVNASSPYYNYYQFLPQHTRTTYSGINIDEYVRSVLGYGRDVYGNDNSTHQGIKTSRLYGKGAFFYNAQEIYGANALLAFGVSRNETGTGTSDLAINKNNGFGLNAVDSNPLQAANWFATFSQSIYDYNRKWVTNEYSNPKWWKYFGSQNGNKYVGMNVKYASDPYWGEKMASHYYSMDKAFGFQDYDFYQTGVTIAPIAARTQPTTAAAVVYTYKSSDNGVVIIDEVEGEFINGSNKWYKVVSDMNVDANFNQITTGVYNWDSYVYVPASYIHKTNVGKNGYISPNDVPKHQEKNYTYDLHIENAILKPKVAISTKETNYYYDPTLSQLTGQKLLNNKYVMVFTTAYDENKNVIAYQVTSDYKYDQKHWVSANSIKFVTSAYGQASVTVPNQNTYTIVNPDTVDLLSTHISGLYHNAYTPILEERVVDGQLWYKVPVNLSGTTNEFGWTLASAPDVAITKYQYTAANSLPIITASNRVLIQGKTYDVLEGVTAVDTEEGKLIPTVKSNTVKIDTPGEYEITYSVKDSSDVEVTKTIKVTVIKDELPVIHANNRTIALGKDFDAKAGVTATDKEDGPLTDIKVIKNEFVKDKLGTFKVTYQVTDSYNQTTEKTIEITVVEKVVQQKTGRFDLDYIKVINENLVIKGYSTIDGIDNNLSITIDYKVVLENINDSSKKYEQNLNRITNETDITYQTPSIDEKDYKYSWFEGKIDITEVPNGDYNIYIVAETDDYYSKNAVNNQLFSEQTTTYESNGKYAMTRNNYFTKDKNVELIIRNDKLGEKTVPSYSNQYGQLEEIKFRENNKLYIYGNAFSSSANLSKDATVKRTLIFENINTFDKYEFDIGSTTKALYNVQMPVNDQLSKERAWYEKELDISDLPIGTYSIYIETISNVSDIGELNEQLFRDLSKVKTTINNKNYIFDVNYSQRYRVELKID